MLTYELHKVRHGSEETKSQVVRRIMQIWPSFSVSYGKYPFSVNFVGNDAPEFAFITCSAGHGLCVIRGEDPPKEGSGTGTPTQGSSPPEPLAREPSS